MNLKLNDEGIVQASLQDATFFGPGPGDKSPGYFRMSLRDFANNQS
jgi:hypothetical protein